MQEDSSEDEIGQRAHATAALGLPATQVCQTDLGQQAPVKTGNCRKAELHGTMSDENSKPAPTSDAEPLSGKPTHLGVPECFSDVATKPSEAGLLKICNEVFGYRAFRGLQLSTIERLLQGQSVLTIMPTGKQLDSLNASHFFCLSYFAKQNHSSIHPRCARVWALELHNKQFFF